MPKPRIDYEGVRRFILVMMADAFYRDDNMEFDHARVRKRLLIPTNVIKVTFDKLEREGLISEIGRQQSRAVGVLGDRTVREWVGTGRFALTDEGRERVEKIPDETFDLALAALASGAATNVYQASTAGVAAPPDKWEPLPIEPGDEKIANVKAALEEITGLVERDNGYKSEFPDERAEVLSAFAGASKLLREASQVGYSSFQVYLLWPLGRLLARFTPDTIIGAAAQLLKDAVKDWVKSRAGDALDHLFK